MSNTDLDPDQDGRTERRFDAAALVAGLVFLGMALAFTLADLDTFEDQVRYVWPASLLALGIGLLVGARRR